MQKPYIIIGGGGHTKVLVGLLEACGLPVLGIVTSNAALLGSIIGSAEVVGLEGEYPLDAAAVTLVNGVGNIASGKGTGIGPRAALYARYTAQGFAFLACISPHAAVQPHATVEAGAQIMAGAVVQPYARIGSNTIINTRAAIDHDCVVGSHSHVAPGAVLCGNVRIGEASHIGAGAVILQNVTVGSNVVIGAGCIVSHDVADGTILRP